MNILKVASAALVLIGLSNCASVKTKPLHHESPEKIYGSDGEAVAFLEAVNSFEVEAAKQLMKKFHSDEVKSFAKFMIKEHDANLKETQKISKSQHIAALNTESLLALNNDNQKELAHLLPLQGSHLDKAYIDAMIKGHTEVLLKLEHYLSTVDNQAVKELLEKTKPHVLHHLEMAKEIKKKLG